MRLRDVCGEIECVRVCMCEMETANEVVEGRTGVSSVLSISRFGMHFEESVIGTSQASLSANMINFSPIGREKKNGRKRGPPHTRSFQARRMDES